MTVIGIIADTHFSVERPLHPGIAEFFSDVTSILHAGDIGEKEQFTKLQSIAPVISVMGNKKRDQELYTLPENRIIHERGRSFFLCHGLSHDYQDYLEYGLGKYLKQKLLCSQRIANRLQKRMPPETDFVVYGHSHFLHVQKRGETVFINPGAAFGIPGRLASVIKIYLPPDKSNEPRIVVRYLMP